jgi:hypothetical protein
LSLAKRVRCLNIDFCLFSNIAQAATRKKYNRSKMKQHKRSDIMQQKHLFEKRQQYHATYKSIRKKDTPKTNKINQAR